MKKSEETKAVTKPVLLKEQIGQLLEQMNEGMYEREETVKMVLLTAIAGENTLLLGPPGVAKSMIAKRLKYAFRDSKYFEYLMTRFSTPDEIFGPISVKKLQEDVYERKTADYLPGAGVVFLDEIYKASSAIQNSLLTAMNERKYFNGSREIDLDILGFITASNEMAQDDGLEAFSDRLLTKLMVSPIQNEGKFFQMLDCADENADNIALEYKLDGKQLKDIRGNIGKVKLSGEAKTFIQELRGGIAQSAQEYLEANKKEKADKEKEADKGKEAEDFDPQRYYFSDRRWKKGYKLLQTSAYLNGCNEIDLMDCVLLKHVLWNVPEDIPEVGEQVQETLEKLHVKHQIEAMGFNEEFQTLKKEVEGQATELVEKERQRKNGKRELEFKDQNGKLFSITEGDLAKIKQYDSALIQKHEKFWFKDRLSEGQFNGGRIVLCHPHRGDQWSNINQLKSYIEEQGCVSSRNSTSYSPVMDAYEERQNTSKAILPVVIQHWDEKVSEFNVQLETMESSRKDSLSKLEERLTSHLFVTEKEAEPLKIGLAKAEGEIKNLKKQVADLKAYYKPNRGGV